jgi:hypothetical protein
MDKEQLQDLIASAVAKGIAESNKASSCGEEKGEEHECGMEELADGPVHYLSPSDLEKYKKAFTAKGLDKVFVKSDSGVSPVRLDMTKPEGMAKSRDEYRPTKAQLKKINAVALETQTEDSGYVFMFQATNKFNGVDRSLQKIDDGALNALGKLAIKNTIPYFVASKNDCEDHTWKAINGYGYCIGYKVESGALYYEMYIPKSDADTQDILARMFSGQLNKLSVGFGMTWLGVNCNSCGKAIIDDECPHEVGTLDEKKRLVTVTITESAIRDNYEISGVGVPCQAGAKVTQKDLELSAATIKSVNEYTLFNGDPSKISLNEIKEALQEGLNSHFTTPKALGASEIIGIDKMEVGKDTIEDNKSMTEAKEIESTEKAVETVVEETTKAADVETVLSDESDKLCKTAERIKKEAVAELKDVISAIKLDNSEVLEAIKSLKEDLVKELTEVKSLKADIEATKAEIKKDLAVAASVPVESVLNAAGMTGKTDVNLDSLTGSLANLI